MDTFSLPELIAEQIDLAEKASSGRSAHTIYGGHQHTLRQTLIALAQGQMLEEHENPGEATLHILHGEVRLRTAGQSFDGAAGDIFIIPDSRHSLEALRTAAVLLTVAKPLTDRDS
ncbi:MAG TPA: cupin domain-containing protein [Actinopolymorphaceae bacterium]|jgi:quercetin dioxygenase-like cupin family protein